MEQRVDSKQVRIQDFNLRDMLLEDAIPGHLELRYPLRNQVSLYNVLALAASAESLLEDIKPATYREAK
jgi:hypothetical protein